jgi:hypothetical protein
MDEREIPFFAHAFDSPTSSPIRQVRSAPSATHEGISHDSQSPMEVPVTNGNNTLMPEPTQLERQQTTTSARRRRRADTSTSLGQAVSKDEGMPEGKVSIKDRIACYRWTFFTMVR